MERLARDLATFQLSQRTVQLVIANLHESFWVEFRLVDTAVTNKLGLLELNV